MKTIKVGNRTIGKGQRCFIIAEAGVNHNADLHRALNMVDVATEARADAVKFQTFLTEALIIHTAPKAAYQQQGTAANESQFDMLKRLEISEEFHQRLIERCRANGVIFLSTPYDSKSAELLDRLGVPAVKISSTDVTNLRFLKEVAAKSRPILLSTGMSSLQEIEEAVSTLWSVENRDVALLQCTSQYPTPIDQVNLRAIATLEETFGCPVGFSDHTLGLGAAPWAVAAGACIIEKHFTLSRALPGPDQRASLEPTELAALVRTIREVEAALGDGIKRPMPCELPNKQTHQKSLVVSQPIAAGEVITANHLACKRPGTGISPRYLDRVVGRRAACDLQLDDIITWSVLVPE